MTIPLEDETTCARSAILTNECIYRRRFENASLLATATVGRMYNTYVKAQRFATFRGSLRHQRASEEVSQSKGTSSVRYVASRRLWRLIWWSNTGTT
jgi:hypothetical protein